MKPSQSPLKFFIYVPGMRADGFVMENLSLGGSESAGLYTARELVRRGHQVTVFSNTPSDSVWDGVEIVPIGESSQTFPMGQNFERRAMREPHDVLIVQRMAQPFSRITAGKLNFYSMHDLARTRGQSAFKSAAWNCQQVLSVSDWHGEQIKKTYALPDDYQTTIRNGIDLALFEKEPSWERKFTGKKLVYMNRPERGLINLVKPDGIMERLYKIDPEIVLAVCHYDNTTQEMEPLYRELWTRCAQLPNVELVGSLSKIVLAELLRDAALLVYPIVPTAQHEETSCIAVMEAQAAGTPIVTCDNGAIKETMGEDWGERCSLMQYLEDGETDIKGFVGEILAHLNSFDLWEITAKACWNYRKEYSWEKPAEALERLAWGTLRAHSASVPRLAKHFAKHNDYIGLKKVIGRSPSVKNFSRISKYVKGAEKALKPGFFEWENKRALDMGNNPGPERIASQLHYQHVMRHIARALERGPIKMLEIGCRTGRFLIHLAQQHKDSEFVGMDISQTAITEARRLADELKLTNVKFITSKKQMDRDFDIVLLAEVLEHVSKPADIVDDAEIYVRDHGKVIVTLPVGPTESLASDDHPIEHIQHFEHQDITELWGDKLEFSREYFTWAVQGESVGGQVVTWLSNGKKTNGIDWSRKLSQQNPLQTLSVIMIVKWDEPALPRTLKSVHKISDEVLLGVDVGVNPGNTKKRIEKIRQIAEYALPDLYPHGVKIFPLDNPPLIEGFSAARNEVLSKAQCDWVLWIDADEEMVYPERLPRFLRSNCYEAYAVPHYHYSIEPAQVLKTDYPTRIFRRDAGFKFWGYVHEHPSKTPEEAPQHVMVLPQEIAISHTGYTSDEIRTERFHRNWPLMERDRKEHPDRPLGKYLFVRDLMHLARYELQKNGNQLTPEIRKWAEEAVDLYRELVAAREVRLSIEALAYATQAALILTNNSVIQMRFVLETDKPGIGKSPMVADGEIIGGFVNTEDAKALTSMLIEEKMKFYEGEYL